MLESQSGGIYPVRPIKEWRKKNLKSDGGKTDDDFYWLEEKDVFKLAKQVKKDHGQYWSDAILFQYGLALRPEEIVIIQTKEVDIDNKHIHISPIIHKDGKNNVVVRRLKNTGAQSTLNLPDFLIEPLTRRKKADRLVLFSREPELGLRAEKRGSEFELKHNLWVTTAFCKHYLDILRDGSTKAKLETPERIDGRTLRRSRGRDRLIKLKSIEKAARFLRDSSSTVEKHYARWISKDIDPN